MRYAIVTGASRGLGEAIAKQLLNEQINVISIARSENEELRNFALQKGSFYKHYSCNLALEKEVQEVFMLVAHYIFQKNPEEIFLFNNAGNIEPIHTVGNLDPTPIVDSIQVNLIAPILITNLILQKAQNSATKVHAINITSGAASRSIEGWSVYCSAKAGLNMFTQTTALEQTALGPNHKIIAFSPGVMDTKMQETIRSSSSEAFRELEKFKEYKKNNALLPADVVAEALVDLVLGDNVENGRIYHVSDLLNH